MEEKQPTIYACLLWPEQGQATLRLWRQADPGWVEVRGTIDVDENDPLQRVIDSCPAGFVSGLFSSEYVAVQYWKHDKVPYMVFKGILDANR